MLVRLSEIEDLKFLPEIEKRSGRLFREIGMDAVADDDPPSDEEFLSFHDSGLLWVIAEKSAQPAGFLAAKILDGCAYLHQISVDPEFQGGGLGRRLIEEFCTWAKGRGYPLVTLSTFRNVPWNGPYYARLGFKEAASKDLGPQHHLVQQHEQEDGLDVTQRCFMKRQP